MAKAKKDFTAADKSKYSGIIGGIDTTNTSDTENTETTTRKFDTRRDRFGTFEDGRDPYSGSFAGRRKTERNLFRK